MSWRWLVIPGGIGLGLIAETGWPTGVDPRLIAADLAVGWLFIGSGYVIWQIQPVSRLGLLLMATGSTWFAGTLLPELGFLHRGPLVHLFAAQPSGRLSSPLRRLSVAAAYLGVLVAVAGPIGWAGIAIGVELVGIGIIGLYQVRGGGRSTPAKNVLAIVVGLVLIDASAARISGSPFTGDSLLVYPIALALTALVTLAEVAWRAGSPGVLTKIVVNLGSAADAGTLRDRLARAIGDPSLLLGYAASDGRSFVDDAGVRLEPPPPAIDRIVTPIVVAGRQTGFVAHDPSTLADQRVVALVAAAVGLAISNSAMQAEIRRRVSDVEESRERLVQAADAQGERIEADLEMGAGTRLGRVAELIADAGLRRPDDRELQVLAADLDAARKRLGEFARGIYPAELRSGGLLAAIAELAARSPVPVESALTASRRYDPAVESTLYFVCSEALANVAKHAAANRVRVELGEESSRPILRVVDDGVGGARFESGSGLRGLVDRVEALGGQLTIDSGLGGTTVTAIMPVSNWAAGSVGGAR